jgi:hypothetical protein
MKKLIYIVLAVVIVTLTSCGGGLPNGRYAPTEQYKAVASGTIQAIIIDGNNFTTVLPMTGMGLTLKYKYTNGTITFTDGVGTAGVPCEYKDGLLWYAGIAFEKTN